MAKINYSPKFKREVKELLTKEFEPMALYALCYDSVHLRGLYATFCNYINIFKEFDKFVDELVRVADKNLFLGTLFDEAKRYVDRRDTKVIIESPYGTMDPKSKFYIEREADKECWQYLSRPEATTLVIEGSRQIGKSSLMQRLLHQTEQIKEKQIIFIDFQEISQSSVDDSDKFFKDFCLMLSDALSLPDKIDYYWGKNQSNIIKCGLYLEQYIMPQVHKHLVIALDEVDKIISGKIATDFFAMLRVWHNKRAIKPVYKKISLFLSISTDPNLLIKNQDQSPFNVATRIILQDFTSNEVNDLNYRHNNLLPDAWHNEFFTLFGGHPFLTRLVLYEMALKQIDITAFLTSLLDNTKIIGHLNYYYNFVSNDVILQNAIKEFCLGTEEIEDEILDRLKSIGLLKKVSNQFVFRNELYKKYFNNKFNSFKK